MLMRSILHSRLSPAPYRERTSWTTRKVQDFQMQYSPKQRGNNLRSWYTDFMACMARTTWSLTFQVTVIPGYIREGLHQIKINSAKCPMSSKSWCVRLWSHLSIETCSLSGCSNSMIMVSNQFKAGTCQLTMIKSRARVHICAVGSLCLHDRQTPLFRRDWRLGEKKFL